MMAGTKPGYGGRMPRHGDGRRKRQEDGGLQAEQGHPGMRQKEKGKREDAVMDRTSIIGKEGSRDNKQLALEKESKVD